jgi:serine/tyrosine/threonine adenylyltransferase
MTLFFRRLPQASPGNLEPLRPAFYSGDALNEAHRSQLIAWLTRYAARAGQDGLSTAQRLDIMNRANPKYVLRNYLAQQAIDAANDGDPSVIERLLRVLQTPYDEQSEHEELAQRRPEWARNKAGCSALSCSS